MVVQIPKIQVVIQIPKIQVVAHPLPPLIHNKHWV